MHSAKSQTRTIPSARPAKRTSGRLKPLARAIAAAGLLSSPLWLQAAPPAPSVNALPGGLQIGAGQASVLTQGSQMTVRNTNGAILNWQSFNIGTAAGVHFDQASATSKVLNRVVGNDPSQLFGSLTSNGQVWLLNPSGVLFGQGARVDVAGLVASTLRLTDNDFLAGRYRFHADSGSSALLRNEGSLRSAFGGQIVLLGSRVENIGSVAAPGGSVTLAAARSVELVDTGLPHLAVQVDVPEGEVLNLGRLVADGGTVDVFGAIVNQQGLVQADTLVADAQGRIKLKAADTLMLGGGSTTQARGMTAGSAGGQVDLLGQQVALVGDALADVSGSAGGGSIRVGGGRMGRDSSVPNARAVFFAPQATLRADATGAHGSGGHITLWSDTATRAYGTLSAQGGTVSGDGGFVETSGGWLDARPRRVNLASAAGRAGTWLLDPNNILINDTGPDANITGNPNFSTTNDSSVISTATIAAALNAGTSVSISTGTGGSNSQAGDILMDNATLTVAPPTGVGLTLNAARDIVLRDSSVVSTGQPLSLTLNAAGSGIGAIELLRSTVTTAGGNITLQGTIAQQLTLPDGSVTAQLYTPAVGYLAVNVPSITSRGGAAGINIEASALNLGAGTLRAIGYTTRDNGEGIRIGSDTGAPTTVNAAGIDLFGLSRVTAPVNVDDGVFIIGDATNLAATSALRIEGSGTAGLEISAGARVALNAAVGSGATLTLVGRGNTEPAVLLASDDLNNNTTSRGSRVTAVNSALAISADSTATTALLLVNDAGAPGPLLDLASATSAALTVTRSGIGGFGANAVYIRDVDLTLPNTGSTLISGDQGISLNQTFVTAGSGAVSFSGQSVQLQNSLFNGLGSPVSFAATGVTPQGVQLINTTLTTGGGNVQFGASQIITSAVLGSTTVAAPWVENTSTNVKAAVDLNGSTIDAGTGTIVGGGANRSGAGSGNGSGFEIFQSSLSAREIRLAGRSDTAVGLRVDGSTLTADRVLTLDGLSAGGVSNSGAGLRITLGSTLQLVDNTSNASSQMSLIGNNRANFNGLVVEGGDAGTANETRITVAGASLTLQGTTSGGGTSVGLQLLGTAAAPGGLLFNTLSATSVTLQGTTDDGTGGGLFMQYATVLGPQTTGTSPLLIQGNGRQSSGVPGTVIDNSTVTTGGTLTVRGDGLVIANSGVTGESGLSLLSNTGTGAPAAGPILVNQSILTATAAGAQLLIQGSSNDAARGDGAFLGGAGVTFTDSATQSTGAGGGIVVIGRGAASGGSGIVFTRSPFVATNITMTGTGLVDAHGILSEDFSGQRVSSLSATNITLTGQSANNATAPDKAGVRLSNGTSMILSGAGTVQIGGDSVALGAGSGTQPFSATGNAAAFTVSSADSQNLRNVTLDFSAGTGATVTLRGDSDSTGGGRVRMNGANIDTGGGNFSAQGVGVIRNGTVPQNTTLQEGSVGVFVQNVALQAGGGAVTLNGTGPNAGTTPAGSAGNGGLSFFLANSISAASVSLTGVAGDVGTGVDLFSTAGSTLNLNANQVSVTGRGVGVDPGTGLAYLGIKVDSASTWAVNNALTLTGTGSGSGISLTGLTATAGSAGLTAAGPLVLAGMSLTTTGAQTLSGSQGVAFQPGSSVSGSSVTISGTNVSFADNTGANAITATTGPVSITSTSGGVSFLGGYAVNSPTAITIDSNGSLGMQAGAASGLTPTFNAGQALNLRLRAPLGLTIGTGLPLDSGLLSAAVAGMSATSTTTLRVTGNPNTVAVRGAINVPGRLVLQADGIELQPGAVLRGAATGDAVVLGGTTAAGFVFLVNTAGSGALGAPNGRWVLLASDPRQVALGGLAAGFSAYNLGAQPWATDAQGNYITPTSGNAVGYTISTSALNGQGLTGLLNKTYDASASITLNPLTWAVSGLNSGDVLSLSGVTTATLADKNVGTARPVALNGGSLFSVLDAGGRPVFGYSTPSFTANVTPLAVSLTGAAVANKVYDGNTTASLGSLGVVTPLAGDSLGIGGTVLANFGSRNVGTALPVVVSGIALTGADAGNYSLVLPSSFAADITSRALAITGLTAQGKAYDASTTATLAGTAAINPVAGDSVALTGSASASFADKNVGNAKAVAVAGLGITGADAGNYTLAQPAGLSANITPATLLLSGLTAQTRAYDSTRSAPLTGTSALTPLGADVVTLTGTVTATFGDKTVGTAKPVTLSGVALAGTDAGNYTLLLPGLTASITPAPLSLAGVAAANKTYDATRNAAMTGTLGGVLAGDTVTSGLLGQFSDANAGTGKAVAWTATPGGADAANYTLTVNSGSTTASITPATLTYIATPALSTVGLPLPVLGGAVLGYVGTDTQASATTGTLTWTTPATLASSAGQYAINGSGLSALNYVLVQAAGNATALTLRTPTTADATTTATTVVTTAALLSVQIPQTMSTPTQGRVLDVTTAFAPAGSAGDGMVLQASSGASGSDGPAGGTTAAAAASTAPNPGTGTGPTGAAATVAGTGTGIAAGTSADSGSAAGAAAPNTANTADSGSLSGASGGAGNAVSATPLTVDQGRSFALRAAGEAADGIAFRALDLSRLPRDEVQTLLAARARYKQKVFSKGTYRLRQDPTLADVRACRTEAELETGTCIVTEQLKQEIQLAQARAVQPKARKDNRRRVKVAALPVIERKLALLIGINRYDDKAVPELMGAVPDARAVRQVLETSMGYETTVLENPSREAIVRAFNKLALEAESGDSVIIYYAGHGVLVPVEGVETGYWLPSDVDSESPSTWLSNADIGRMVAAVAAKQVMLVSDSCYSGQLVGKDRVQVSSPNDATELLKRRAAVVMSSGGDEPVADQGRNGHSVFAWHFMRALEGLDQWQVGGTLYDRVRTSVVKDFPQTPQYGASRGAGHQGNTDYLFERRELEALKP